MDKKELEKLQAKVEKAVGEVVALFTEQSDKLEVPNKKLNAITMDLVKDIAPHATQIRRGYKFKKSDFIEPGETTVGVDPSEGVS